MPDNRLTDERLRTWLNSQPERERLCLDLLPYLGEYTQVQPRRPMGGPDGARDLEARLNENLVVWGAVGFRNSPSDSSEDKAWVKKKYRTDLSSALGKNSSLRGFVFFTNVDLTPGEVSELCFHAASQGIEHSEVFYRERLRQVLDSPAGYGFRLQYLDVGMSKEEQISFLDNYNEILRDMHAMQGDMYAMQVKDNHENARLRFLHEAILPIDSLAFMLVLDKPARASDLGHFRIYIDISTLVQDGTRRSLHAAFRDLYLTTESESAPPRSLYGIHAMVGSSLSDKPLIARSLTSTQESVRVLRFNTALVDNSVYQRLIDIDGAYFDVFVTERLLEHTDIIALMINNYAIIEIHRDFLITADQIGLSENISHQWPGTLTESEASVRWRRIYIRSADTENESLPPPYRHFPTQFDFRSLVPQYVEIPRPPDAALTEGLVWWHE
jgi:hypothetical protein